MNSLRFLLVHRSSAQAEEITACLALANHTVLPTSGLEEAVDALTLERFDAVLMEAEFRKFGQPFGLPEFSAQLRRLEQTQKFPTRVPVIALAGEHSNTPENWVDAVVPEPINAGALTATVSQLARALSRTAADPNASDSSPLPILDVEKFREQVGFDNELLVEIIDLFLEERKRQSPEMIAALAAKEFDQLNRVAHTIKGSLASLQAPRARTQAQMLELAARDCDADVCRQSLAALESDLADLEPQLLALRNDSA